MEFSQALSIIKTAFPRKPAHKREARALFRASFGSGKYRIEASDAVSVYGTMPNTNQVGWYLYAESVERAVERLTWK